MTTSHPLVSFCLMACRQKELIREALASAMEQDYEPLEILVSDDNSQDGTWEIIKDMACKYHGPHKIVLNHNAQNLGTIGNWQKLCSMASGELLIKADGDDISYPNRARTIAEDWLASGRKAAVMASSYDVINGKGEVIGEKMLPGGWDNRSTMEIIDGAKWFYLGATIACHRSLYEDFPSIQHLKSSDCAAYEARGLFCRMALSEDNHDSPIFHPFRTISQKLVKYRLGSGDTTGGAYRSFMTKGIYRSLEARRQALDDLQSTAKNYLPPEYFEELLALFRSSEKRLSLVWQLWSAPRFSERLEAYRKLPHWGNPFGKVRMIERLLLFPPAIGDFLFYLLKH